MSMIDISPSAEGFPDPHLSWQAERERLKLEFASLHEEDISDEKLDRQNGEFMARELPLIEKIKETPVTTIEGALCQIEAIDQHERMLGLMEDQEERAAIRTRAVASIRRCIGLSAAPAVMQEPDPHHAWIERYRILDAEAAEELGDSVGAAIL